MQENPKLRNAILDVFFDELYVGLASYGFRKEELPQLEEDIRQRFGEYDSAMSSERTESLVGGFGLTAAKHVLGRSDIEQDAAPYRLAMMFVMHFTEGVVFFGKLFAEFKIVD